MDTSFFRTLTLQDAIVRILTDATARKAVIRLNVSLAASGINSHGYAILSYETGDIRHRAFYLPRAGTSPLEAAIEQDFEQNELYSPVSREIAFSREFFESLAEEIERTKASPTPPAGDGSEYDAEEAQQDRYRKLRVYPGSQFLNIGVDNQVTWPKEETLVKFDRYHFILMPKTQDHVQSIHVDLTWNQLSYGEAMTLINRFLSIMTWCDDQFAIAQDGWAGTPAPTVVFKRDLAFATTHMWIFDRKIPSSDDARRALALYREARNAEQSYMISYPVLNYYKIVEIRNHGKGAVKKVKTLSR